MKKLVLCATLVWSACHEPRTRSVTPDWFVTPAELSFGQVELGESRTLSLQLVAASVAGDELTVVALAPFETTPGALELRGASSLEVRFAPAAVGALRSELVVRSATREARVVLTGEGVASCVSTAPCQDAVREDGACRVVPAADGTPCTGDCVADAQCVRGRCEGRALSCDDADACTVDACRAGTGCVHQPVECTAATNPCEAAACDAQRGCVVVPVADGTRCGASDCASSLVCIVGQCVARPTPEHAPCGEDSPCQALGTCELGACVRPSPSVLQPFTTQRSVPSALVHFAGVVDPQGNVFFVRNSASGNALVSTTRNGVVRFEAPLLMQGIPLPGNELLDGTTLVLSTGSGELEARDANDGGLLWHRNLDPDEFASCPSNFTQHYQRAPTSDGRTSLLVLDECWPTNGTDEGRTNLVSLDIATGARRWHGQLQGTRRTNVSVLISDGTGGALATSTASNGDTLLASTSVTPWVHASADPVFSTATFAGHVVVTHPNRFEVLDAVTGMVQLQAPLTDVRALGPLMIDTRVVHFAMSPLALEVTDVATRVSTRTVLPRAEASAHSVVISTTQPVLTNRDSVVVGLQNQRDGIITGWSVAEFGLDGSLRFECELASTDRQSGWQPPAALRDGVWTFESRAGQVSIESYLLLPFLQPAASGWVTPRGKVTQEGRPR